MAFRDEPAQQRRGRQTRQAPELDTQGFRPGTQGQAGETIVASPLSIKNAWCGVSDSGGVPIETGLIPIDVDIHSPQEEEFVHGTLQCLTPDRSESGASASANLHWADWRRPLLMLTGQ